ELAPVIRGAGAIPLTFEVRILAKIDHLRVRRCRQQSGCERNCTHRGSITHGNSPSDQPGSDPLALSTAVAAGVVRNFTGKPPPWRGTPLQLGVGPVFAGGRFAPCCSNERGRRLIPVSF